MVRHSFKFMQLTAYSMMALVFGTCSRAPEAARPGSCPISCGGSIIAGSSNDSNGFSIQALDKEVNITCFGDFSAKNAVSMNMPVQVRFIVNRKVSSAISAGAGGATGAETGGTTGGTTGDTTGGTATTASPTIPAPGITFEPVIQGHLDPDNSGGNVTKEGNTYQPMKYAGIVTPMDEWCSDACGVATLEVWPMCLEATTHEVKVRLMSGSLASDPITIKITNPTKS